MRTIAIIGCGATAVAFIRSFVNHYDINDIGEIKLLIFEPAETLGVGVAYQEDLNNLLINRPAQTMSASLQLNEFFEWLKEERHPACTDNTNIFTSRQTFGRYLTDILNKTFAAAKKGIQVKIVKENVTHIQEGTPFFIATEQKNHFFADYIVLAVGNNQPNDFYSLKNTTKYIHVPYPLCKSLQAINAEETVGIIGNSLTAIDIALSLDHLKHKGMVTMLSRAHTYPRVRGVSAKHELQFLTAAAIQKKKTKKGSITLRDALRLLRKELKAFNFSWKSLFVEDNRNQSFSKHLLKELKAAKQERKWQPILSATNQIIEDLWHAFDQQSKAIFIKSFQRFWLNNRSPIPPKNAAHLLQLVRDKKLRCMSGLKQLNYNSKLKKYVGRTEKGKKVSFDWVINATGPSRYVQPEDTLLYNLIQDGIAREHLFGGIDVDFSTAALINNRGQLNSHIRLLGHNTLGVYNYTSSLEMIVNKATKIAHSLLQFIKGDKFHGKNQVANITNIDCPGHFAQIIN